LGFSPLTLIIKRNNASEIQVAEFLASEFQNFIPPYENSFEPQSDMVYPIVDYMESITLNKTNASLTSKVVGNLVQSFYWRDLIKDTLPTDSNGLIVVFDTECTKEPFTYRIE
jgi:hypothetical protein